MKSEAYTPGHTQNASDFMAKRTLASHGAFMMAYLSPGMRVLDCGCGPGTITLGIAERVSPGSVVGVDYGASQVKYATRDAAAREVTNAEFLTGSCYSLPFDASSFDCVFSHALFEHLSEPCRALAEFHRVLKPNGLVGVCSPDWGAFVVAPPSKALSIAIEAYTNLQAKNGGDVNVGRKLGS
jgi:ubiquinone/menaquinone biosynthesis C-methylase UbiE